MATDGATRMIFAIFAVDSRSRSWSFIWLLLKHPANLYSPWQYTEQTSVEGFAAALSRENRTATHVYSQAISETIARASASAPGEALQGRVAQTFERLVESSSITIDRSLLLEGAEPVQIPVTSETTADELLDSVFLAIRPAVGPFIYAKSWVLANENGVLLTDIGTEWANSNERPRDERALPEVGIVPGSKLRLLRPPLRPT